MTDLGPLPDGFIHEFDWRGPGDWVHRPSCNKCWAERVARWDATAPAPRRPVELIRLAPRAHRGPRRGLLGTLRLWIAQEAADAEPYGGRHAAR
jgi:hypothetical protein